MCRARAWSTCEGVRVKMLESGRANKAETRKKPVGPIAWDRKWESRELGERGEGIRREHFTSESQPNTCVYAQAVAV